LSLIPLMPEQLMLPDRPPSGIPQVVATPHFGPVGNDVDWGRSLTATPLVQSVLVRNTLFGSGR
jgi:hypothetical protein